VLVGKRRPTKKRQGSVENLLVDYPEGTASKKTGGGLKKKKKKGEMIREKSLIQEFRRTLIRE